MLFALGAWIGALGLVDLTSTWFLGESGTILDAGYGAITGIIVPVGFLLWPPQTVAAAASYVLAGLWSGDHRYAGFGAIVAGAAAMLIVLRRPGFPRRFHPLVAVLTIAAVVPAFRYAHHMERNYRRGLPPIDFHVRMDVWTGNAAMAIGIVLVAGLGALGSRVAALSAAAAAFVFGLASASYPDKPASVGLSWGIATLAWSIAVAGAYFAVPSSMTSIAASIRGARPRSSPREWRRR